MSSCHLGPQGVELHEAEVVLSDRAGSAFGSPSGLRIPWDIALGVLDHDRADDEALCSALRARLPEWLDDEDLYGLGALLAEWLPPPSPLVVEAFATGVYGQAGFSLGARWLDDAGYGLDSPPESPAPGLVRWGDGVYRLTLSQFAVLAEARSLADLGRDREADLSATARLSGAVVPGDPSVVFNAALAREAVVTIDAVQPRFVPAGRGAYRILPVAPGVPEKALWDHLRGTRGADEAGRRFSFRDEDGRTVRVVSSDRARAALYDGKRLSTQTLGARQVAQVLADPERHLPRHFDLSALSDRVTGFGPVPVLQARRMVSSEVAIGGWWDWQGVTLEDAEGTLELPLDLDDPAVLAHLERAIAIADQDGAHLIPHPSGEGFIALSETLREAVRLRRAAAEGGDQEPAPRQGLLVKENLEDLEYVADEAGDDEAPVALAQPPGLSPGRRLLPHQLHGVRWLRQLWQTALNQRSHGAILADDMGLGKTLQVLALWSHLLEEGRTAPHLVVAPVALLDNWRREAIAFFGARLEPIVALEARDVRFVGADGMARYRVVLVSYEGLRRNELEFARVAWDTIVLDEAQKAKNPGTQTSRVVRTLAGRLRLAVTGTPVENSLRDLWTLCDWSVPALLGTLRHFTATFVTPIRKHGDAVDREELARRLHARIEPVFLRRLKTDVLTDLPAIHHHHHTVAFSSLQERAYTAIIRRVQSGQLDRLASLMPLFAVCAHPGLVAGERELDPEASDFPKAARLIEILTEIRARGEKALIFASRKAVQAWIAEVVAHAFGVRRPRIINGDMAGSLARLATLDSFQATPGFGALVLAPRAAGVGLNVTGANHVIHYMREWNPAVENQATDRCYRIGQTRDVHVHTITCESERGETVEQRLAKLLEAKRRLIAEFAVPMGDFEVDQDELAGALTWRSDAAGTWDPDLFEPDIVPLLTRLATFAGIEVHPPDEHLDERGRVLGLDDGAVTLGERRVYLVDVRRVDAGPVARGLERMGLRVVGWTAGEDAAAEAGVMRLLR